VCHQSVGLIARHLEAAGFPTIGLTSARTITARANPPRSVFVDAPLGHTAGPPDDNDTQRTIVDSALRRGFDMTVPGAITDLDLRWGHDDWKDDPLAWSRRRESRHSAADTDIEDGSRTSDSRTARSPDPQYQSPDDRRAAETVDPAIHRRTSIGVSSS
jgi:hypothetical protein